LPGRSSGAVALELLLQLLELDLVLRELELKRRPRELARSHAAPAAAIRTRSRAPGRVGSDCSGGALSFRPPAAAARRSRALGDVGVDGVDDVDGLGSTMSR